MKKLMVFLVVVVLLVVGYNFYFSPSGQDTLEKTKIAKVSYEIINEKDPAQVLEILEENEETLNLIVEKQIVTESQITEFKSTIEEMKAQGELVDKRILAEKYLKEAVVPEDYQKILDLTGKEKLSLEDIATIVKLLEAN